MHLPRSARVRFGVPFAVAGIVALIAAVPAFRAGPGRPRLPNVTVAQVLAKAASPRYGVWKGDIHWTAALGLPGLSEVSAFTSSSGGDVDWSSLASGSHDVKVWSDGGRLRLALLGPSNEVDLYAGAGGTWYYDSVTNTATRLAARPGSAATIESEAAGPERLGRQLLEQVVGLTDIRFGPSTVIAGRPAYVLNLTPRPGSPGAAVTTLGRFTVAIDAANGVVLQVALYPARSNQPALQVGFRSVDFLPAGRHLPASTFAFSPGPGVTVATRELGPGPRSGKTTPGSPAGASHVSGSGWGSVVVLPGVAARPAPGAGKRRRTTVAGVLDAITTPVSGSWGSGRLLQTGLINALVLPDGDVAVGMVSPAGLEAAVSPSTRPGRAG